MHDDGPVLCVRVVVHDVPHPPSELQQGVGEGVGVTGPLGVVEQDHLALLVVLEEQQQLISLTQNVAFRPPHLSEPDGPDHEVGELLLVLDRDPHAGVDLLPGPSGRPVLHAHDADEVEGPGHHDDAGGALLPDHAPKVADRRLRRALGNDVRLGLDKALEGGKSFRRKFRGKRNLVSHRRMMR